jgi:hypothetical protein
MSGSGVFCPPPLARSRPLPDCAVTAIFQGGFSSSAGCPSSRLAGNQGAEVGFLASRLLAATGLAQYRAASVRGSKHNRANQ